MRRLATEAEISAAIVSAQSWRRLHQRVTLQIDGAASLGSPVFPPWNTTAARLSKAFIEPRRRRCWPRRQPCAPSSTRAATLAAMPSAWPNGWRRCRPRGQVVAESASKQTKVRAKASSCRASGAPARPGQQLPGTQRPGGPGHARRRRQEGRAQRQLHRGHRPGGGKRVLISASDSAVKGGTIGPWA